MVIGNYEIIPLMTGLFRLDGGAMFGVVPRILWEKRNPPDDSNRIHMCARALLLKSKKRNLIIDTGLGDKFSKKLTEIYAVDNKEFNLSKSLNSAELSPNDINDVILTHLHFDHSGGCTYTDEDKKNKPMFPNAVHHLQGKHFEWACNPSERDKASFIEKDFMPLSDNNLLNKHNGEVRIDEFVTLLPVNGHTRGMQLVKISDDNKTLFFAADLIPMSSHIPLPYIMGYDLFPLLTLEEKKNILHQAAINKWYIFFEHDPNVEIGTVGISNDNFFLESSSALSSL